MISMSNVYVSRTVFVLFFFGVFLCVRALVLCVRDRVIPLPILLFSTHAQIYTLMPTPTTAITDSASAPR